MCAIVVQTPFRGFWISTRPPSAPGRTFPRKRTETLWRCRSTFFVRSGPAARRRGPRSGSTTSGRCGITTRYCVVTGTAAREREVARRIGDLRIAAGSEALRVGNGLPCSTTSRFALFVPVSWPASVVAPPGAIGRIAARVTPSGCRLVLKVRSAPPLADPVLRDEPVVVDGRPCEPTHGHAQATGSRRPRRSHRRGRAVQAGRADPEVVRVAPVRVDAPVQRRGRRVTLAAPPVVTPGLCCIRRGRRQQR